MSNDEHVWVKVSNILLKKFEQLLKANEQIEQIANPS